MIGQYLKQYQIETLLGQGGLGTVYRAQDNNLSRDVALKIIYPRFANRDAFRTHIMTQAKTAARLIHPGIATIYDFAHDEKQLYLVIEYVPGHSLAHAVVQLRRRNKLLPLAETLWLTAQVADALAHAHQHGMLHRNLKPSNILVKAVDKPLRAGERPLRAMLTDFGLTRLLSGDVQSAPVALADALPYMSPEQTVGQTLDGRSDVYALGVILYQLATGRLPFTIKSPTDAMVKHCADAPLPPQSIQPTLPDDVTAIINKALAKRATDRYQDAAEMADAIRQAAAKFATSTDVPAAARTIPFADLKLAYDATSEAVPTVMPGNGVLPMPADDLVAMLQAEIAPPEPPAAAASDRSHREDHWPALIPQPANEMEAIANGVPVNQSQTTPVLAARRQRATPTPSQETDVPAIPTPATDQIVIMRPGRAPRQVQLDKLQLQIGRSRDNDIVLATPDVSRRHARLQKTENGWQVTDLNSSGGTYWGDHRLLPHVPEPWNHNQLLRIGPYTLRWQPVHTSLDVPPENHADQVTELHQVPRDGTQTGSSSGQFSLMVSPTVVTLAPAARTTMQVEIFNQGATADTFSLRVADLPSMLVTLSQNSVHLAPGTRASLPITLAVPADGDLVAAGHYPFQIVVKAQRDAAETAVVSARLTIAPLEKFSLRVWPLEMTNGGECQVMIRNEGNADTRFSLTGQSPHATVRFSGERGHVPLSPGQATTLALTVAATERPLFGRRRRRPFHVRVRTDSGAEQVETGRLDVEPKLPSWTLPVLEILLVALLSAFVITSFLNRSQSTDAANPPAVALPETVTPAAAATAPPAATVAPTVADPTADDDGDGLSNGDEIDLYNTDPALTDTDGDGLDDGEELDVYGTEPTYADTDLDGVNDGEEVSKGTDPLRFPVTSDTGDPAPVPTDSPLPDPTSDPGGYVGESDAPEATAVPIVPTDPPAAGSNTVPLSPVADGSGWVSQSGEATVGLDAPAQGGDLDNNQPVRGFFSYDLAQLPDGVTIESARLNFGAAETSIAGAPFGDLGCLLLEAVEFELPLDAADFDAPAFYIDCVNERPSVIDVAIDVQDALDFDLPYLQIRFGYDVATDNDGVADLFLVRSAPTLEVVYTTP